MGRGPKMLRISKLTDYGIVLSTQLALAYGRGLSSVAELSGGTGIPQPTVSKVLKSLARHGLIVSQRGAQGGYRLARPPAEVSVVEIITVLEGPIAVTECSSDDSDPGCQREDACGVRANWQRINRAVEEALAGVSLAEMAVPPGEVLIPLVRSAQEAALRRSKAAETEAAHRAAATGGPNPGRERPRPPHADYEQPRSRARSPRQPSNG